LKNGERIDVDGFFVKDEERGEREKEELVIVVVEVGEENGTPIN